MECLILPRSGSFVNASFVNDDDSDFAEEDLSDFTGSRNSFQFDYNTTEDNHVAYMWSVAIRPLPTMNGMFWHWEVFLSNIIDFEPFGVLLEPKN